MQANLDKTGIHELQHLDRQLIWHPFTALHGAPDPIVIADAKGIYLHAADGRKIIDAISSWWVNLHGHSNPDIADAIASQARSLEHVIFAGFTHEPAIKLAKNLKSILPSNQEKVFFSDNGSTAVEVALKLSIQFWHNQGTIRRKIIAFEGAYHGDTFGAMAVGGRGAFNQAFDPFLFDVEFLPVPNDANFEEVSIRLEHIGKSNEAAAFIFEPLVQAAAGMVMYKAQHLDRLLDLCKSHNIVTIADEVFTGFGRTGKLFACDYLKNQPDLIAVSKGITGGALPLGVTGVSTRILAAFTQPEVAKTFFHGHSYTANPLTCAAANKSFELLTDTDCLDRIASISKSHEIFVRRIHTHPMVQNARSLGTIVALEIKTGEGTNYFHSIRDKIYNHFLQRNILLRPLGNVIYILPPYVITGEELNFLYNEIEVFLDSL